MAATGRNGPQTPKNEASSPVTACQTDGQQPPERADIIEIVGGVERVNVPQSAPLFWQDASLQHWSVLRDIHPFNPHKIIST